MKLRTIEKVMIAAAAAVTVSVVALNFRPEQLAAQQEPQRTVQQEIDAIDNALARCLREFGYGADAQACFEASLSDKAFAGCLREFGRGADAQACYAASPIVREVEKQYQAMIARKRARAYQQ